MHDAAGDPAWRIFTLETFGGVGTLVQSDFRGTSPALHLPWTTTFVKTITFTGWTLGLGITPQPGDNALVFSVSAPASANETLDQAIADDEYLTTTIAPASSTPLDLRNAELRFTTRRIGFHAPSATRCACTAPTST